MTVAVHPDILSLLQSVHEDVQRKVAGLDRYRALKAIEQTISDFPGLTDVAHRLSEIQNRLQQQLDETREFRALRALERIIPELPDVLALVEDRLAVVENSDLTAGIESEPAIAAATSAGPVSDGTSGAAHANEIEVRSVESSGFCEIDAPVLDVSPAHGTHESADGTSDVGVTKQVEPEHRASTSDATSEETDTAPIPSLADSVAQFMAQSMAPREALGTPPSHLQERSDTASPHAERAA